MATRLEINFNRLLARCESIAKNRDTWDWRVEKYVAALQDQLADLKKSPCKPSQECLTDYSTKVDFLKGLLEAEKKTSVTEKALAADKLPSLSMKGGKSVQTRELHLQTKARFQTEMRDELLGTRYVEGEEESELRHRKVEKESDIDTLIQHERQKHEKLAEEMLHLTRNLKQSVKDSGKIVLDDNKKLTESSKVMDSNYSGLKKESERLEKHTQTCSWWIWVMLALVTFTFLFMIVFIRLFGKKR
ncbi:hypothetical protein FSP39_016345 [Pinctada imbricata]|uniref:Vesicle transport protein USE1 n=1 Tax=Pinctada imbricata TaxID=66713 RepID=A0AA88YEY6_PINIB|nr:hypothetical protein FSP39_016345 [Pinctada imbricata]